MNAAAPQLRESRRRYWWVLVMFLLGVLVGWLLAPRCKSGADSTPSAAAGGGAKLNGDGEGGKLGSGQPKDGRGDKPMGPGSGTPPPGYDAVGNSQKLSDQPSSPPAADQSLKPVDSTGIGVPDPPGGHVLKASDFRYDKTGLPRYAQSVSTTGSTLYHAAGSTAYHSTAAIITSSRFEEVVDWVAAGRVCGQLLQIQGTGFLCEIDQRYPVDIHQIPDGPGRDNHPGVGRPTFRSLREHPAGLLTGRLGTCYNDLIGRPFLTHLIA
jgi:hypothetical protein